MFWTKLTGKKRVICAKSTEKQENLILIKNLAEQGKMKSIIDKIFTMEQAAEAHRYMEKGNRNGSVVIRL